ncbi:MAG: GTP-binding protein, partial [Anaerolineales bacterium]|nr:GTP-binding protein [Anaerolineales bacterium]
MKEYKTGQIRNIALISHNGAGKTTLVERMLFNTGVTTRMGDVQSGSAAMDFEEEEINRSSSISTALAPIEWKDAKINVMDTPGYADFIGEVNAALAVAEGAMVLVEAVSGVEVGTEIVWAEAEKRNLPRLVVINKMDRENVRAARAYQSVLDHLNGNFIPLQLPIGEGATFQGVVDLLSMEARLGENDERGPIPDDLVDLAEEAHLAIVEAAAEGDDALMEKYFENDGLPDEDIVRGLRLAMKQGSAIPVIYSAPQANVAIVPLMNAMVRLFPAPNETEGFSAKNAAGEEVSYPVDDSSPLAAFIFKTREDPYGRMSYIRVYGGILESDSRVWDAKSDSEVRVGSLQILTGKEQSTIAKLHSGDIGAVVKLGDAHTNDTLCDKGNKLEMASVDQPHPIAQVAIHPVSQSDVAKLS